MTRPLKNLSSSLQHALELIDQSNLLPPAEDSKLIAHSNAMAYLDFSDATSLLDKCSNVVGQYNNEKPILRLVHHPACSGGTLISKCLSALPNTYLLSEVHPHSDMHLKGDNSFYSPTDLVTLARFSAIPNHKQLANQLFLKSIELINQHTQNIGAALILREHTHFDFFKGDILRYDSVANILKNNFHLLQVISIRNPIDSYLSLIKNNWVAFRPSNFDEYCRRFLAFSDHYVGVEFIKYEDFVIQPEQSMEYICNILKLKYTDIFTDIFDIFNVTGDSGRKGARIEERLRGELNADFIAEVKKSKNFREIQKRFKYESI